MQYNYSNNGVTVRLVRDVRKKNENEECPLRWRITHRRKQIYYSTGMMLDLDDWDLFNSTVPISQSKKTSKKQKERIDNLIEIDNSINNFFENVLRKHVKELADNNNFSFEALNLLLGKADVSTVNDAFRYKISLLKENDSISTATIYECALSSLEGYKGKSIQFMDVTVQFLKSYQNYMDKKGLKRSTIGMYMRNLRTIIKNEGGTSYLKDDQYPFGKGKYIIPTGTGRNMALRLSEIHKIENHKCKKTDTSEMCRDLWLFSFYGSGVNFSDICRMEYKNIINGEIYFIRKKTTNTTNVQRNVITPIIGCMDVIIEKYGNEDKTGLVFPFLNDCENEEQKILKIKNLVRLVNDKIKHVAKELNLDGADDISTYTARHSYSTILSKLRVPESFISEQLGHSKKNVTQGYIDAYDKDERISYNSLLLPKVIGNVEIIPLSNFKNLILN